MKRTITAFVLLAAIIIWSVTGIFIVRKELEVRYTNLKMARTISIHDKDINDTKQRLSRLVREVDKCIALLNE